MKRSHFSVSMRSHLLYTLCACILLTVPSACDVPPSQAQPTPSPKTQPTPPDGPKARAPQNTPQTPPPSLQRAPARPSDTSLVEFRPFSFEKLVEKSKKSVVNIYTTTVTRERPRLNAWSYGAPRERVSSSLGTGFIIDREGFVLTNHHVIKGASKIRVRMWDDTEYEARIIGDDPKTDIAILQIQNGKDLQPVPLGDSDEMKVGQWVLAIGNALGLNSTVTAGIVSAKGRSDIPLGGGTVTYADFIQTDASINPGNSGGPLLNMKGEVIGINTAIRADGQGIGFAIPINMARVLIPQLRKYGKVTRSWLGVFVAGTEDQPNTPPNLHGAIVRRVVPGGPAAKAGLQQGDVIVKFNGVPISSVQDLRWKSSIAGIGQTVQITVQRGDTQQVVPLVMARNPKE